MHFTLRRSGKPAITNFTSKRFFTSMNPNMFFQVPFLGKPFLTMRTSKWLCILSFVQFDVLDKWSFVPKQFSTYFTWVFSLPRVCYLMSTQICRAFELQRTIITLVRPEVTVRSTHMSLQESFIFERSWTVLATEIIRQNSLFCVTLHGGLARLN